MTRHGSNALFWLALALYLWRASDKFTSSSSSSASSSAPSSSGAKWTDGEMLALARNIRATGIDPETMLLIYTAESGLDPHASSGSAWGLNQAQGPLLRAAGWEGEPKSFGALSVSEQAPWLAKMLQIQIRQVGASNIKNALDLYVMNLSPVAARDHREVIYSRENPAERDFYEGNKGFDRDKTGRITREQVKAVLDRVSRTATYTRAVEQLHRVAAGQVAA